MIDHPHDASRLPHRTLLRIAVLLSIISLIPIYAAAASASTAPCTTGTINIDDTAHTVTSNSGCAGAVTIPTGVTSIGTDAFMWLGPGVSSLTSVTFESPSVVTSIASGAFYESGLTSITIPTSVTTIGEGAFQGSISLTSVTFAYPSHMTTIDDTAFALTALASITIPESVSSIGDLVFARTVSLASVYFAGNAPTHIGPSAYADIADGAKIYRFTGATGFDCHDGPTLLSTHPCNDGDHWPEAWDPTIADIPFPAQPPAPTATAGGQWDQISVTATSSLIGPTPTSITIAANPGGATCDVSGPSGSCVFKSLNKDTQYTFTSIAHNADPTPSMASDASAPVTTGSPVDQIITQLHNHPDPAAAAVLLQMLKDLEPRLFEIATSVSVGPPQIGGSVAMNIQVSNSASHYHQPELAARATKQVLCSVTKKIKRAGRVKLACRYTKAALKLLRQHAVHATLTVTFTPVSGTATTKTKALTIKRLR